MKFLFLVVASVVPFVFLDSYAQEVDQHYLRVQSNPNIIFIGGAGLYDVGTMVTVDAAPETWQEYTFVGWKIDGRWAEGNPVTVRMDQSHTVEAIYSKEIGGEIIVDAVPRIAEITIDGEIYLPSELPATFSWNTDTEHTIVVQKIVNENTNTRYVLDSWKDQSTSDIRTIFVEDDSTDYIALYKTQHYLKPISERGKVIGGGWHDAGSTISFELESEIVEDKKDENIRYVFDSWNLGDYQNSQSNSIDLEEPTTVRADWDIQFNLQLQSNIPDYDLFGTGWYDEGRQVALIAEEELTSPKSDIKYVFDRWVSRGPNPVIIPNAHSPSTTITMDEPYVIEAQYKKSFQVNVWTPFASPIGAGFYDAGEVAEITLSQTEVTVEPNKLRKIFNGWDTHGAKTMDLAGDDPDLVGNNALGMNLIVFVDKPLNVTANWKSQYYLDLQTTQGKVKGGGWYDMGRLVPISVEEQSAPAGMWSAYTFDKWTGDIEGDSINERVMMNGPKSVIAEWKVDNTPGIINGIILAAIAGIGAVVYSKTRKNNLGNNVKSDLHSLKENSFEKFFELRKSGDENTPSFYSKPPMKKSIMDWLLGRDG